MASRRWRKVDEQDLLEILGRVPAYQPTVVVVGRKAHEEGEPRWAGRESLLAKRLTELTGVEHVVDGDVVRPA